MKNEIVAIVVTYNRCEILKKNIECLLNQKNAKSDILIINNASTDGTEEMILHDFDDDRIIYCNTGINRGGAGGFEFGIGKAVALGYDYIWIMDDDTWPSETALFELVKADKELDGKWGFLSSAVYWTDGKLCNANKQKKTLFTFIGEKESKKTFTKVVMSSFVSMFIKARIVKEVGLPIGEYFIWTDDYEFSSRISKKYPCYFVSKSSVTHFTKSNLKHDVATDDISRVNRYRYLYRNDVNCYRQFGVIGWAYILMKQVYSILRVIFVSKDNKKERIRVIVGGYKEGLKYSPEIKRV